VDASQGGGGRQVGSPVDRHLTVKTWRSETPPGPGRTPDELTVLTTRCLPSPRRRLVAPSSVRLRQPLDDEAT
jgi:hypothetical protein